MGAARRVSDADLRADPGFGTVRAVAAGADHTCALKADGSVWCIGSADAIPVCGPPAGAVSPRRRSARTCGSRSGLTSPKRSRSRPPGTRPVSAAPAVRSAASTATACDSRSTGAIAVGAGCAVMDGGSVRCWGEVDPPRFDDAHGVLARHDWACALRASATTCFGDGWVEDLEVPLVGGALQYQPHRGIGWDRTGAWLFGRGSSVDPLVDGPSRKLANQPQSVSGVWRSVFTACVVEQGAVRCAAAGRFGNPIPNSRPRR